MGLGVSILLVAVGSIMIWAVEGVQTAGGCVGAFLSGLLVQLGGVPSRTRDREVIIDRR